MFYNVYNLRAEEYLRKKCISKNECFFSRKVLLTKCRLEDLISKNFVE